MSGLSHTKESWVAGLTRKSHGLHMCEIPLSFISDSCHSVHTHTHTLTHTHTHTHTHTRAKESRLTHDGVVGYT